jgi:hypothetical protein
MARMSVEEVWDLITYCGDALVPQAGQNDLRVLTVEAVHRLPRKVQDWLLLETDHVFIGGHGQWGEFITLGFPPREVDDGLVKVRVIFLSEQLMGVPAAEVLWTVAREVGNSWLDRRDSPGAKGDVDRLVARWGFPGPESTAEDPRRKRAPGGRHPNKGGGKVLPKPSGGRARKGKGA